MSSVAEFVAAAVKAEPALSGSNDKDRAAIQTLEAQTAGLAQDLKVSLAPWFTCLSDLN